jgi:hypothetical protein
MMRIKKGDGKGNEQLFVSVVDGKLQISIGIALLAFAVQAPDGAGWPEDWHINDINKFAASMARQLRRESENGTTPVHRMFDAAAIEVLEQGEDGVDEGSVEIGIKLAQDFLGPTHRAEAAKP